MQLPPSLRDAIENWIGGTPLRDLERAADQLSRHYREHKQTQSAAMAPELRAKAYLAVRFAATYGAVSRVLRELPELELSAPESILDLGAGPATAALAASHLFPNATCTLFETDAALREAGRALLPNADWRAQDFTISALPPCDLVIAAWSVGETKS
ncbi:MAG: hypothetical protein JNL98_40515, partial [Bryobacterales bacterium]|nr:hypothetical protein [Bryobacterales bacterium]